MRSRPPWLLLRRRRRAPRRPDASPRTRRSHIAKNIQPGQLVAARTGSPSHFFLATRDRLQPRAGPAPGGDLPGPGAVQVHEKPPRRVRVEQIMGTAIGLDLREPWVAGGAVDKFFGWLRSVDVRFSTYREDSRVSRLRRGEISTEETDEDFDEVPTLPASLAWPRTRRADRGRGSSRCCASTTSPSSRMATGAVRRGPSGTTAGPACSYRDRETSPHSRSSARPSAMRR
jgi:hypothetical protein